MHRTRISVLVLFLATWGLPRYGAAQQPLDTGSGVATLDDFSGSMALSPDGGTYLNFEKIIGDGVGNSNSLQRFGFRSSVWDNGLDHLYLETHAQITDEGRLGYNVGGGVRYQLPGGHLGFHGSYDETESQYFNKYNQFAVGTEYLSEQFDVRVNGYIPVGGRDNFIRVLDQGTDPIFFGNFFGTKGTGLYERSLGGFDSEVGTRIPGMSWTSIYAGPYFLKHNDDDAWGFKARTEARIGKGVNLNFMVSDDNMFGTNLNMGIEVKFSGGLPTQYVNQPYALGNRRYDMARKAGFVQLDYKRDFVGVPLTKNFDPIRATWVDDSNGGAGTGTYEDPFHDLPNAAPGSDLVMVRRGNRDTRGHITLENRQRLLGEGKQYFVDTDRLGIVAVPDQYFDNSGQSPVLRGVDPARSIVTLASNNEVRNFTMFDAPGATAPAIAGGRVHNFYLDCLDVVSYNGAVIGDASGLGIIRDSKFSSRFDGANLIVNAATDNLRLEIDDIFTTGGDIGTIVRGAPSDVTLHMANYTGNNHAFLGLGIEAVGGTVLADLDNVVLNNSGGTAGDGILINAQGGGTVRATLDDVRASGNGDLLTFRGNRGRLNVDVNDSAFNDSTGGSGVVADLTNSVGTINLINVQGRRNAEDGLHAVATGPTGNSTINVVNGRFNNNGDDAFDTDVTGGATLNFNVDPTIGSGSGGSGYEFTATDPASRLNARIFDTDLSNNGQNSIDGQAINGGVASVRIGNVDGDNNGRNGLSLRAINNGGIVGQVDNSTFRNNGVGTALPSSGIGVDLASIGNSGLSLTLNNVLANNNGQVGHRFDAALGSVLISDWNGGDLSNNPINNILGTVAGAGAIASVSYADVNADNSATNGGYSTFVSDGGRLISGFGRGSISNTQGDGVRSRVTGAGSQAQLTFGPDTAIDNNRGDGVDARMTGGGFGSRLNVTVADGSVRNNDGTGVITTIDGVGARGSLRLRNTPVTNNGDNGVVVGASGGSRFTSDISNVAMNNNGAGSVPGSGFISNASGGSIMENNFRNVTADNNTGDGFNFIAQTGALSVANFSGSVSGNNNDLSGFRFDAATGGAFTVDVGAGTFSRNGLDGVRGIVSGPGSIGDVSFAGTQANNNGLNGFNFNISSGGNFTGQLVSDATHGTLSAQGNNADGVNMQATGAGTMANLLMRGDNNLSNNGTGGVDVDANGVAQAVAQVSGNVNNNGGDGVNILFRDVNRGAISITGNGTSTINDNTGDGIDIDLINSNLLTTNVAGHIVRGLEITGYTEIADNAGDGINVFADNTDLSDGLIDGNTVVRNGGNAIVVNLTNGSDWNLDVTNNTVLDANGHGIVVTADSGTSNLTVSDNTVQGSLLDNILVDLSGTATAELHIDRNQIDGDGVTPTIVTNVVQSFISPVDSVFTDGEPPDAMGAVGLQHLVELVNNNFRIYDKTTGALVLGMSDEEFWEDIAGANLFGSDVFDHRILFDPTTNKWIASTITRGAGNQIILAVSNTADPTGGWRSVQFRGDLAGLNFNDFDTLGFDSDAVVIGTNDFGAAFSVSAFSIPKSDLFGIGAPSVNRMTRIQGLAPTVAGTALQAAVDHGPSDGRTAILAVDDTLATTNQVLRTNILGGTGIGATLSPAVPIGVPNFNSPANITTPNGTTVRANSDRFWGNTVEVNNELWAVHHVAGAGGLNELRWYRIDEVTNAVISTGTIADPNLSLFMPSIAVNNAGQVVIGYHAGSATTAPSAYASAGVVQGNTVNFSQPTLLTAGTGEYGGGRWGDYSATVVDPSDPNRFWTILETGRGVTDGLTDFQYGEAFNAIEISAAGGSLQTTTGDGIHVIARDTATIAGGSTINGNTVTGSGRDGILVDLQDSATLINLRMYDNESTNNTRDGISLSTENTGNITIEEIVKIDGNVTNGALSDVTGNGRDGVRVVLNRVQGEPDIAIDNNNASTNAGQGVNLVSNNTDLMDFVIRGNITSNNTGGDGIHAEVNNTTARLGEQFHVLNNVSVGNAGDGVDVNINNVAGVGPGLEELFVNGNTTDDNTNLGINIVSRDTSIAAVSVSRNFSRNNLGGQGILFDSQPTGAGPLTIGSSLFDRNFVTGNAATGVDVRLQNVNVGSFITSNSTITGNAGAGLSILANNSPINRLNVVTNNISNNTAGDGILFDMNDSAVGDLTVAFNGINGNAGDGIDFDLDNSPISNLRVLHNSQGSAVNIGLDFLIAGNTFPVGTGQGAFRILNSSDPGINVTDFTFDIGPAGRLYNTETGANFPFTVFNNSDVTTGLATVNGTAVPPYFDALVPDFSTVIDMTFNDFNPTEAMTWDVDADVTPGGDETVAGNELIGSIVTVNFTGGLFLTGALTAVAADPTASQFVATAGNNFTGGISGNTGDGIRLSATNGSNIGRLEIDDNVIDSNDSHGVEMLIQDSTLPSIQGQGLITNNTITNNGVAGTGDGVRLLDPDTNDTPIALDFTDNTISNNTGVGINIRLNNLVSDGALTNDFISDIRGNTISENGSFGMRLDFSDDVQFRTIFGTSTASGNGNTFNANQDAGVALTMQDTNRGTLAVVNSSFNNTTNGADGNFDGQGFAIRAIGGSTLDLVQIGDPASTLPGNTHFDGNAAQGLSIRLQEFARMDNPNISRITANTNGSHGIELTRQDASDLGLVTINEVQANGNGANTDNGAGLFVNVTNAQFPAQRIDVFDSTFNNNDFGMDFTAGADAILVVNATDNTANNNRLAGIRVTTNQSATFGDVSAAPGGDPNDPATVRSIFSGNTVNLNGTNGFEFNANDLSTQAVTINASAANRTTIDGNTGNGIDINATANSFNSYSISETDITNVTGVATGDGINVATSGNTNTTVNFFDVGIGALLPTNSTPGLGGNGIALSTEGNADLIANVGRTGFFNDVRIYNNTGDGINVRNNGAVDNSGGVDSAQSFVGTFRGIDSRFNDDQGFDAQMVGNLGGRAIQGDGDNPYVFDIQESAFATNNNEGVAINMDANFGQNVCQTFFNPIGLDVGPAYGFNSNNLSGGGNNPFFFTTRASNYTENTFAATADDNGFDWQQLYSAQVAQLILTGNIIQNNGIGGAGVEHGVLLRVGTNTHLEARVDNNTFGGNALSDFRTEAFVSTNNATQAFTDRAASTAGNALFDQVFLDDTAQLDLSFAGNVGDQINVGSTLFDFNEVGTKGNKRQRRDIFVVNDALNLNANNSFIQGGVQQNMTGGTAFDPVTAPGSNNNDFFYRTIDNLGDPNFPLPRGAGYQP